MAITRDTNGTLIVGDPSTGGRAIGISAGDAPRDVVVVDWFEEGVGLGLTLEEALAARDELNTIIDVYRRGASV
jgi:hypothetical protein